MQGQRRIVLEMDFETALGETCRALRDEGLRITARVDVRDQFWRDLGRDFPRYFLLQAWSPELAFAALDEDLDAAAALQTTVAVYDAGEMKTVVVVCPGAARPARRHGLVAEREDERIARVIERLQPLGAASTTTAREASWT